MKFIRHSDELTCDFNELKKKEQEGGDPAISMKTAGHTMLIKSRYYKKGSLRKLRYLLKNTILLLIGTFLKNLG